MRRWREDLDDAWCALQHHWTPLFIWWALLIKASQADTLIWWGLLLVWTLRVLSLGRRVWLVLILACLVVGGQTYRAQVQRAHQAQAVTTERTADYLVKLDPLAVTLKDQRLSGQAQLAYDDPDGRRRWLPVRWFYPLDEASELAPHQLPACFVKMRGQLQPLAPARNFYVFDYAAYLAQQGIHYELRVEAAELLGPDQSLTGRFQTRRAQFLGRFLALDDQPWVSLHNKLLWNLSSSFYREQRSQLASLGLVHYFAVSGFHLYFLRRSLRLFLTRWGWLTVETSQWVVNVLLFCYGGLIAWPVGVVRSLGQDYLGQLSKRYRWPLAGMDCLALVGILVLLVSPRQVHSLGFVLSFLMAYLLKFYSQLERQHRSQLLASLETTCLCLLFSWPLLLASHYQWNPLQLVFVVCFSGLFNQVIMPLVMLTAVAVVLPANPLTQAGIDLLNELTTRFNLSTWLGQLSQQLTQTWGRLPAIWIFLLFALACYWLWQLEDRPRRAYGLVTFAYLLLLIFRPLAAYRERLVMIDVGQGDAVLYQTWRGEHWLIDTGGRVNWRMRRDSKTSADSGPVYDPSYAERNLLPALQALGVHRLTGVIITHPDLDHMGNLPALAAQVPIEQLILTRYSYESTIFQAMLASIRSQTELCIIDPGQRLHLDRPRLELISLPADSRLTDLSNDSSLVAWLQLGPVTYLATGDLSSQGEALLLRYLPDLQADLLKLGHHGSETSSSDLFLDHVDPSWTWISAGVDNRYGHPSETVLERLSDRELPSVATNEVGAVMIWVDHWGQVRTDVVIKNLTQKE